VLANVALSLSFRSAKKRECDPGVEVISVANDVALGGTLHGDVAPGFPFGASSAV
jgi:hypothetical protein